MKTTIKIIILLLAIVMVVTSLSSCALMAVGAIASAASDDSTQTNETNNTNVSVKKSTPKTKYYVNETYEIKDLGTITFNSVNEYESDNRYTQPKENYKYIVLSFTIKNTSKEEEYFYYNFECYADNIQCESHYFYDEMNNSLYIGDNIGSGRIVKGNIYFEVPIDATSIEVEYHPFMFKNTSTIFVVK